MRISYSTKKSLICGICGGWYECYDSLPSRARLFTPLLGDPALFLTLLPGCAEGSLCELRVDGVLRSWVHKGKREGPEC